MSTPAPYIRSLLTIAMPLVIAGLASNSSIIVDRAILAYFDIDMMSHVSTTSSYCWMILYLTGGITFMSKIIIGQCNGAAQYAQAAKVTWQMIFFSLACGIIFMFSYYIAPYILPPIAHQHGLIYFKIIMCGGIFWPLAGSLSSFFIGTYQIRTVFISLMIANIANVVLDILLIPSYGTYGAALATVISMGAQCLFLMAVFLNNYNRAKYQTHHVVYNKAILYQAVRIGYPESLSHFFEMMAWSIVISYIATKGRDHLIVTNLAQTLFILFMFVYTEIGSAVKSMCSNYIGADKASHIPRLILSSLIVHSVFMLAISSIVLLYPSIFIKLLSLENESLYLQTIAIQSLRGVFVFMFFDGISYIFASVISAYGDTFSSMLIMTGSIWGFLVIPTYLMITYTNFGAVTHSIYILPTYGILTSVLYLWRYQTKSYKQTLLIINP